MHLSPSHLWMFLLAALLCAGSLPLWQRVCRCTGLIDDPGDRKIHLDSVPLAGGPAVLTALLGAAALVASGATPWPLPSTVWPVLTGAALMTLVGLLDDRFELEPGWKLLGQLSVTGLVVAGGLRLPPELVPGWAGLGLTVLWILAVTNAVNFTDNMNGLCAGLGCVGAAAFALRAAGAGPGGEAAITVASLGAGALAGFLPWNFPRGRVFLGDSGSHLAGYLLAVLPLLRPAGAEGVNPPVGPTGWTLWAGLALVPAMFVGIPLLDLLSVMVIRVRAGRPVWVGDNQHFSHRLVRGGLRPWQAVAVLWGLAAALATAGLAAAWRGRLPV